LPQGRQQRLARAVQLVLSDAVLRQFIGNVDDEIGCLLRHRWIDVDGRGEVSVTGKRIARVAAGAGL
jgi:hypothetical protein